MDKIQKSWMSKEKRLKSNTVYGKTLQLHKRNNRLSNQMTY